MIHGKMYSKYDEMYFDCTRNTMARAYILRYTWKYVHILFSTERQILLTVNIVFFQVAGYKYLK